MKNYSKQVSICVAAHCEGYFLHKTLESIRLSVEYAKTKNLTDIEIIIHLDNADKITKKIAHNFKVSKIPILIIENKFGDVSKARNYITEKATGKYILMHDGDDMFTSNFLYESFVLSEKYNKPTIFCPEYIVNFNKYIDGNVFHQQSTLEIPGRKSALFETNLYTSNYLAHSDIFKKINYESNGSIYGFEDWHWNTKAIVEGYNFQITPNTSFFYRKKTNNMSLLSKHLNSAALRPTKLFQPKIFRELPHDKFVIDEGELKSLTREYVNPFRSIGSKTLTAVVKRESVAYRAFKHIYHSTRMFTSPVISRMRRKNHQDEYVGVNFQKEKNSWAYNQNHLWKELNSIEPVIMPTDNLINSIITYKYIDAHLLATAYYNLCIEHGDTKFDDVLLVPWINKGGADLAMIDLVKNLSEAGRKVLVISTYGRDSLWKNRITQIDNAVFLESHVELMRLNRDDLKIFLLRILQNWNISTLTVMNSTFGFEFLDEFGRFIDSSCRVIVHSYALPIQAGYLVEAFPDFANSLQYIDEIITDSDIHRSLISKIYGYPTEKITKIGLTLTDGIAKKKSGITRRILFANRIANEKQPDIAIKVVNKLEQYGIAMDIFGTIDEDYCKKINFYEVVNESKNVDFKGSFDGVKNLDFDAYDICFMPSLYEGIPRIVLESINANLFIIASDVGGMSEVIKNGKTGIIVKDSSSVDEYVGAIKKYYDNQKLQDLDLRFKHNADTIYHHSKENYNQRILNIYKTNKQRGEV